MSKGRRVRQTGTILDRILMTKADEIADRKARISADVMRARAEAAAKDGAVGEPRGFVRSLSVSDTVAIIAEVKRRSPSKGLLADGVDAAALADAYVQGGADGISVLTDEPFFGGTGDDLQRVRQHVALPVLRKDFVIDAYQVDEARVWGADAVLLIVSALDDVHLRDLLQRIRELEMDALVEVHTETEFERALGAGARLIGINNRNLHTFATTLDVSVRLARLAPPDVVLVSESGIRTRADVTALAEVGVDAVLIGESFVTSPSPRGAVAALAGVPLRDRAPYAETGDTA